MMCHMLPSSWEGPFLGWPKQVPTAGTGEVSSSLGNHLGDENIWLTWVDALRTCDQDGG